MGWGIVVKHMSFCFLTQFTRGEAIPYLFGVVSMACLVLCLPCPKYGQVGYQG